MKDSHDRFTVGEVSGSSHDASGHRGEEPEVFPEAMKVIGILRERLTGGKNGCGTCGKMGRCFKCISRVTWRDGFLLDVFGMIYLEHMYFAL